jgi:hypothetical protein
VFLAIGAGFGYIIFIAFGSSAAAFSTFWGSCRTLFLNMLEQDVYYDPPLARDLDHSKQVSATTFDMEAYHLTSYIAAFYILFGIIMLNLILSIIISSYEKAMEIDEMGGDHRPMAESHAEQIARYLWFWNLVFPELICDFQPDKFTGGVHMRFLLEEIKQLKRFVSNKEEKEEKPQTTDGSSDGAAGDPSD